MLFRRQTKFQSKMLFHECVQNRNSLFAEAEVPKNDFDVESGHHRIGYVLTLSILIAHLIMSLSCARSIHLDCIRDKNNIPFVGCSHLPSPRNRIQNLRRFLCVTPPTIRLFIGTNLCRYRACSSRRSNARHSKMENVFYWMQYPFSCHRRRHRSSVNSKLCCLFDFEQHLQRRS